MVVAAVKSGIRFNANINTQHPGKKSYNEMTKEQKDWYDIFQRRVDDKDWRFHGETWDDIRRNLANMFAYTLIPPKNHGTPAFAFGNLSLIRATGVLVLSHHWLRNQQKPTDNDLVTSIRLYRCEVSEDDGRVRIGGEDLCIYGKSLSVMPYVGGRGEVIDYKMSGSAYYKALELESCMMMAATKAGADKFENDITFPPAMLGFSTDNLPELEDSEPAVLRAALHCIGCHNNGDYLIPLYVKPGKIIDITRTNTEYAIAIVESENEVTVTTVPNFIKLRENIKIGEVLHHEQAVGDIDCLDTTDWSAVIRNMGDYAANWILDAVWNSNIVQHEFQEKELICTPYIFTPQLRHQATEVFLDLRDELGHTVIDPQTLKQVAFRPDEAKIHVVKLQSPPHSENFQFTDNGLLTSVDLWSMPSHFSRIPRNYLRNVG